MITKAFVDRDLIQQKECHCGEATTTVVRVHKDWGRPPHADTKTSFAYRLPCGHCPGVPSQDLTPAEIGVVHLLLEE